MDLATRAAGDPRFIVGVDVAPAMTKVRSSRRWWSMDLETRAAGDPRFIVGVDVAPARTKSEIKPQVVVDRS